MMLPQHDERGWTSENYCCPQPPDLRGSQANLLHFSIWRNFKSQKAQTARRFCTGEAPGAIAWLKITRQARLSPWPDLQLGSYTGTQGKNVQVRERQSMGDSLTQGPSALRFQSLVANLGEWELQLGWEDKEMQQSMGMR